MKFILRNCQQNRLLFDKENRNLFPYPSDSCLLCFRGLGGTIKCWLSCRKETGRNFMNKMIVEAAQAHCVLSVMLGGHLCSESSRAWRKTPLIDIYNEQVSTCQEYIWKGSYSGSCGCDIPVIEICLKGEILCGLIFGRYQWIQCQYLHSLGCWEEEKSMMGGLGGTEMLAPGGQEANIKRIVWVSQHSLCRHVPGNITQLTSKESLSWWFNYEWQHRNIWPLIDILKSYP